MALSPPEEIRGGFFIFRIGGARSTAPQASAAGTAGPAKLTKPPHCFTGNNGMSACAVVVIDSGAIVYALAGLAALVLLMEFLSLRR